MKHKLGFLLLLFAAMAGALFLGIASELSSCPNPFNCSCASAQQYYVNSACESGLASRIAWRQDNCLDPCCVQELGCVDPW